MFFQQNTDNKGTMICLNPVQDDNDCVERGLFLVDNDLCNKLTQKKFRKILLRSESLAGTKVSRIV